MKSNIIINLSDFTLKPLLRGWDLDDDYRLKI